MATAAKSRQVNVHEAKTHFSKILARVEAGEEVVIARAGKPIAKMVRLSTLPVRRKGGFWKGMLTMSDDFNDPLPPEILAEFEDGPIFP